MTDLLFTLASAALINNLILHWPLGSDTLLADADRLRIHALGLATTCLMLSNALLGRLLYEWLLHPLGLTGLRLFVLLALAVGLIGPVLKLLARVLPRLPLAGLWPLLLGNAAILGAGLLGSQAERGLGATLALGLGGGLGFWLVLSLFDDLRQRTRDNDIALPFRGLPIELISAGLIGVAFLGFTGLFNP